MLRRHSPAPLPARRSRGFTLAELVVALGVGGVVFGAFALAVAHQERVHTELARRIRAHGQLREGTAALTADLGVASPAAGDFTVGAAHDSAIQLRTTIGTAVLCEVSGRSITPALSSFATPPKVGDTVWAYHASDTAADWTPLAVVGVAALPVERAPACPFPATASAVIDRGRVPLRQHSLELSGPAAIPIGAPLRVTRPARYSLYRSPDGRWYLGRREWSPARADFETVQPVSGPYQPYAGAEARSSGLELRYVDRRGDPVTGGTATPDRITGVAVTLRTPPPPGDRIRDRRDVTSVTVAVRNPP